MDEAGKVLYRSVLLIGVGKGEFGQMLAGTWVSLLDWRRTPVRGLAASRTPTEQSSSGPCEVNDGNRGTIADWPGAAQRGSV